MVIPQVDIENGSMTVALREIVKANESGDVWNVNVTAHEPGHVSFEARGTGLHVYHRSIISNGHAATLFSVPDIYRCGIVTELTARDVNHALRLDNLIDAASIAEAVKWSERQ